MLLLEKFIGNEYYSIVTGVTEFGLFCEIDNFFISGLLHVSDLPGDRYFYDRDANVLRVKKWTTI